MSGKKGKIKRTREEENNSGKYEKSKIVANFQNVVHKLTPSLVILP